MPAPPCKAFDVTFYFLKTHLHKIIYNPGIGMPKVFVLLLPLFPGWRTMKALSPTLAYDIALTQDMPPLERATRVSVPTQIIVGQKSPAAIHDVGRQLAKAIPSATFAQLPGQDHMVNAKSLLPLLSGFLK